MYKKNNYNNGCSPPIIIFSLASIDHTLLQSKVALREVAEELLIIEGIH